MFNLNLPSASLLGVDGSGLCSTPKTPEIVNTLIAMQTNPLDNYIFTTINVASPTGGNNGIINCNGNSHNNSNNNGGTGNSGIDTIQQQQNYKSNSANQQFISQDSSHSSCSGSPLDSPAGTSTTPSVQQTCSQLIKAGLKLSIQSKRKISSGDSSSGNEQPSRKYSRKSSAAANNTISCSSTSNHNTNNSNNNNNNQIMTLKQQQQQQLQQIQQTTFSNHSSIYSNDNGTNGETSEDDSYIDQKPSGNNPNGIGLTPEDEDRRRRRRERNKIAATKCRMKKRERTFNLISESETLEKQNIDLKSQVQSLEMERRQIFEMLQIHNCLHPNGYTPDHKFLQSPACKYLKALGLCKDDDMDSMLDQQQQRTVIPPVDTIKYSRMNGFKQQQHQPILNQNHLDMLPNGYCKPSPTPAELGYLNSPTQDVTSTCHLQQMLNNSSIANCIGDSVVASNNVTSSMSNGCLTSQQQQQQQHQQQMEQTNLNNLLKNDSPQYNIPTTTSTHNSLSTISNTSHNCDTFSDDGHCTPTVDAATADFVLKSEYADSPYTTDKSAERFLCETTFDTTFDIKHNSNSLNNNNNNNNNNMNNNNNNLNSHNNNHSTLDFNSHLNVNCSVNSYDHILNIKNDFLSHEELLNGMCGDGPDTEFTDLDTGISYVHNITNGGCLA